MKVPNTVKENLPGTVARTVSFIPLFNWIALIYIGKKCVHKISIILGIAYGVLTFAIPDTAPYIWVAVMLQYSVVRWKIKKRYMKEATGQISLDHAIECNEKTTIIEPQRTIADQIPLDKNSFDIISFLQDSKIPFVDKRAKGGCLWIIGGDELKPIVEQCGRRNVVFQYKADGSRSTGGHPAWWLKDNSQPQSSVIADNREELIKQSDEKSGKNIQQEIDIFSDVALGGRKEKTQPIPVKSANHKNDIKILSQKNINVSNGYSSQSQFINDMGRFADKSGEKVPFVPFMTYWPTYDSMDQRQKSWYFYWRTEVRNGNYIDTDLSYIFVHVYELLNEVGWKDAQEGYDKLLALWMQYRERYPKLDRYMFAWLFDFAWLHNLEYMEPDINNVELPYEQTIKNILIDKHGKDRPLKLSLALIDSLCDYSFTHSKFYKDGHQLLMQEAIPRVIALVDASLIKKENRGILSLYASNRIEQQSHYIFQSAVCQDANKKVNISVKAYTSDPKLRGYINEIVRFSENKLREIYGYKGRLRGVSVEKDIAVLIEKFLQKEYSPFAEDKNNSTKERIVLDFNSIRKLRVQSNAVRDALEVPENTESTKEFLTDLDEVKALLRELSPEGRALIDHLVKNEWECENHSVKDLLVQEINRQASKYLACSLLVLEQGLIVMEDDYRDELDYIYTNHLALNKPESEEQTALFADCFLPEKLSERMRQLIENLSPVQKEILYAVLQKKSVQETLEKAAEKSMSMVEIMIDEINDIAMQYLDDILMDTVNDGLCVLEPYEEELKQAMK